MSTEVLRSQSSDPRTGMFRVTFEAWCNNCDDFVDNERYATFTEAQAACNAHRCEDAA